MYCNVWRKVMVCCCLSLLVSVKVDVIVVTVVQKVGIQVRYGWKASSSRASELSSLMQAMFEFTEPSA